MFDTCRKHCGLFSSWCPWDLGFVFPPEAGLPGGTALPPLPPHGHGGCSRKIVLDHWLFSQTFIAGEGSRSIPAGAEASWHGFCSWCYRSQAGQGPCPGAGREPGAEGHGCPRRLLHVAGPIGSSAFINATLLSGQAIHLWISPWRALFDRYQLPSSYVFLKLNKKKVGGMQGASCPPLPSSPGLQLCFWWKSNAAADPAPEEAAFPGGSVAQFSGAVYTVSSLLCESVNRSELRVWFASPCVAGNACHISLLDVPWMRRGT